MNKIVTTDLDQPWNYSVPTVGSDKLMLLTIGGIAVFGPWKGFVGETYLAWRPLPKTDKLIQDFLQVTSLSGIRTVERFGCGLLVVHLGGETFYSGQTLEEMFDAA